MMSEVQLDESQRAFCESTDPYIRLLAPAGAGKTLAILYRCKRLIERNPLEKILIFTFTRVARDELRIRIKNLPSFKACAPNIVIATLNAYGHRIVKNKAGILSRCKIIEPRERQWVVINNLAPVIAKSAALKKKMADKRWRAFHARHVLDLIDDFKSLGFDHERILTESDFVMQWNDLVNRGLGLRMAALVRDLERLGLVKKQTEIYASFFKFYIAATNHLKSMNLYTLEDQKYWGWKYSEKGIRLTGAARYAHIIVDEFQDVNPVDIAFIKSIRTQHEASLSIVGDDDQTIFEWRGSTPQYILHPEKHLSSIRVPMDFTTCLLARNYRSAPNIVDAATALIRHNVNRVEKHTQAVHTDRADIVVRYAADYDEVVEGILRSLARNDADRVALITRKRSQLIPFQIIFADKGLPFFAAEDLNVFLSDAFEALKDLVEIKQAQREGRGNVFLYWNEAILRLVQRIRKYPLNKADRDDLRNYLCECPLNSPDEAVAHLGKYSRLGQIFKQEDAVERLAGYFKTHTVEEMLNFVGEQFDGLKQDFCKADDDIFYADPPFAELANFSKRYGESFDRFYFDVQKAILTLAKVAKPDEDGLTDEQEKAMGVRLHLMTALRTKGKEFDSVYILGANEGVWPIKFARVAEEFEAERRLFYVAVTRARKELILTVGPKSPPSPYLKEMGLTGDCASPNAQLGAVQRSAAEI